MIVGVVAGLMAGALWGLTFIAPLGVDPYSGIDLTVARYIVCGAISMIVILAIPAARGRGLTARDIGTGMMLGLIGNVGQYAFLALAVASAGAHIAALIVGMTPLMLVLAGNGSGGRVSWDTLLLPMILIGIGLLIVNGMAFSRANDDAGRIGLVLGAIFALISMGLWVTFAVVNTRVLAARPHIRSLNWTAVQGLGAGTGVLVLAAVLLLFGELGLASRGVAVPEARPLVAWALVTGIFGTWVAGWLWIVASKRVPLALSGQLVVGETVFGLIYGFMWEKRWPTQPEAIGIGLMLLGVMLGFAAFGRVRRRQMALAAG